MISSSVTQDILLYMALNDQERSCYIPLTAAGHTYSVISYLTYRPWFYPLQMALLIAFNKLSKLQYEVILKGQRGINLIRSELMVVAKFDCQLMSDYSY